MRSILHTLKHRSILRKPERMQKLKNSRRKLKNSRRNLKRLRTQEETSRDEA
jgi:hypothetical protein